MVAEKEVAKALRALASAMFSDCRGEYSGWARGYREGARRIREAASEIESGRVDMVGKFD